MIFNARDLSPEQKRAIESLLGRPVLEDEEISVRAIHPPALSDQRPAPQKKRKKSLLRPSEVPVPATVRTSEDPLRRVRDDGVFA